MHKFKVSQIVKYTVSNSNARIIDLIPYSPFMWEPVYEIELISNKQREIVSENYLELTTLDQLPDIELDLLSTYTPYCKPCECGAEYTSEPSFHMFYCPKWERYI